MALQSLSSLLYLEIVYRALQLISISSPMWRTRSHTNCGQGWGAYHTSYLNVLLAEILLTKFYRLDYVPCTLFSLVIVHSYPHRCALSISLSSGDNFNNRIEDFP